MAFRGALAVGAACTVALGSLSACSSNKSTGSSSTTSNSSSSSQSSVASPPTGTPIVVNMIGGFTGSTAFPEMKQAALAAQSAVNAAGGVHGQPVKVSFCDTGASVTDPAPVIQCLQSAISNPNMVAEVGDYTSFAGETAPIENTANLATIAPVPLDAPQMSLPDQYPLLAPEAGGDGNCVLDNGAKTVGLAYIDVQGSSEQIGFGNIFLQKAHGATYAKSVPIPFTETDITPYVTALSKLGGVTLGIAPSQTAQYLQADKSIAPNQILCAGALGVTPQVISTLGSSGDGLFVEGGLPIVTGDNPGAQLFRKQMAQYQPSAGLDEPALNAWLAVTAFAQVANQTTGPVTRSSVAQAWKNLSTLQVDGLLPPQLNLKNSPIGISALGRVSNVWVEYGKLQGGKLVPVSTDFVSLIGNS